MRPEWGLAGNAAFVAAPRERAKGCNLGGRTFLPNYAPTLCFGAKNLGLGLADIVLLWLALLATVVAFWKARPLAGVLLVPYLLWVTFASALNFALCHLNR